jgi:hypothetical protein
MLAGCLFQPGYSFSVCTSALISGILVEKLESAKPVIGAYRR